MKQLLLFFICSIALSQAFAQTQQNDSLNRINRKYRKELSVDVQGLFMRSPGATAIYKIKRNDGRIVRLNSQKNYRLQLGLSGNLPLKERNTIKDTNSFLFSSRLKSAFNVSAMVGTENVIYSGRFNLYTGVDFGPYFSQSVSGYTVVAHNMPGVSGTSSSWNGDSYWLQNENQTLGVAIIPFIGAKYRFSEHFSACIESGVNLAYFMAKSTLSNVPFYYSKSSEVKTVAYKEYTGLNLSMQYLRFLTFNYHF